MRSIHKWITVGIFAFLITASAFAKDQTHFDCTPSFPFQQPWFGADAAYSIPLQDGRDIWIFGDTLYGDKRQVTGDDPRMVRNTVGVSTCKDGQWKIDYTIRHAADGKLLDFFESQHKDTWYWALDGVVYNNELWVTLLCVKDSPKDKPAALGFEICGTDLAHVTGLKSNPQDWKVSYFPLVPDGTHANPSASAVIEGDYLNIFAVDETGSRPEILTRIPLSGLGDPQKNLQYLGSDDQWHAGLVAANAKPIMKNGASEMSVRYHPELKKWIAVHVDATIFSDKILLRTSPTLTGPWTDGDVIYKIPELQKDFSAYDPDTFCYAGKEHPEFEKPGELVFTYVCNSMKPKKIEANMAIYFPKVVRMKMPETTTGK